MKIERLEADMVTALKNGDHKRRLILSDMVASIRNAAMNGKTRQEITEPLTNQALTKYQKTVKDMIDSCPASRPDLLAEYEERLKIVNEYAPSLISDEKDIRQTIVDILDNRFCGDGDEMTAFMVKSNRGAVMKMLMPKLKGKVDMSIANKVIASMLK